MTLHLDDAWMQTFTVMKVRAQLRVPVRLKGETIGSLSFSSRQPDLYREEDVEFGLRVADHVALALAHQRLAEEARRGALARDEAAAQQARADQLERELEAVTPHRALGRSRRWNDVLAQAGKVARTDTTVLLTGESGTGKEVVARFIHRLVRAQGRAVRRLELRGAPGAAPGVRAVRAREGRVHGRALRRGRGGSSRPAAACSSSTRSAR